MTTKTKTKTPAVIIPGSGEGELTGDALQEAAAKISARAQWVSIKSDTIRQAALVYRQGLSFVVLLANGSLTVTDYGCQRRMKSKGPQPDLTSRFAVALMKLGVITQAELEIIYRAKAEKSLKRDADSDLETVEELCQRHGWEMGDDLKALLAAKLKARRAARRAAVRARRSRG